MRTQKSTKAKKTARRSTKATRAARKSNANSRTRVDADLRITFVSSENPRREGTEQYKRFAALQKFKGKTVGAFQDAGAGYSDCLRYALAQNLARVGK